MSDTMRQTEKGMKFRVEELKMLLEAIAAVRPNLENKVKAGFQLTGQECSDIMADLMALYSVIGSGAERYAEAINVLQIICERQGNVKGITKQIDRRKNRKAA